MFNDSKHIKKTVEKRNMIMIVGSLIVIATSLAIYLNVNNILTKNTNQILKEVMESELPNHYKGKSGIIKSGNLKIWYEKESKTDDPKGTIVFISGATMGGWIWPDYLMNPFIDSGYQVIRFDHRGTGMSDWVKDWDKKNPYTLSDMGKDVIAILDSLKIDKAHIIGASMGGMIGQHLAIEHQDRILSLTSMMSSGYAKDPELPKISKAFMLKGAKLGVKYGIFKSEKNTLKFHLGILKICQGDGDHPFDTKGFAEKILYEMRERNGFNSSAMKQHEEATKSSGSRYKDLANISIPVLVIHGKSDPITHVNHSMKYSKMIPNAKTLWIDGMGHETSKEYSTAIINEVFSMLKSTKQFDSPLPPVPES